MFTVLLLATAPFVLLVAFAGKRDSYALLLLFGFFLGIAGTTFAVGIPFVNAWFEADRRGFATGVFGAGMGGTALSAFFTPRFVDWFGYAVTHVIIAVALVAVAFLVLVGACATRRCGSPNTDPVVPKLVAARQAAGDLADVVPVRRRVRRLRRVLDLPADLPQGRLRLRPDRRRAPGPPGFAIAAVDRPADRRRAVRPDRPAGRRRRSRSPAPR